MHSRYSPLWVNVPTARECIRCGPSLPVRNGCHVEMGKVFRVTGLSRVRTFVVENIASSNGSVDDIDWWCRLLQGSVANI